MSQLQDDANEYVRVINAAPNAWGMCVHPIYGASHHMLHFMRKRHGEKAFDDAVDVALATRRTTT